VAQSAAEGTPSLNGLYLILAYLILGELSVQNVLTSININVLCFPENQQCFPERLIN